MMRRVKFLILSLLCAFALIVPNAAYAWPGANTRETAAVVTSIPFYFNSYLTDAGDEDWFVWTNNTGTPKPIQLGVYSVYSASNFNLYSEIVQPDGSVNVIGYAYDTGFGGYDYYYVMVYPGHTIRFKVENGYQGATGENYPYWVYIWFME